MTLRTRLGILVGFIVLFLALAPVVVLYTAGYRWNFKKHKIEKIGILFMRSKPDNAHIWLNDELLDARTPTRIRDLLPGTYHITVGKEGYAAWSKDLSVESAKTTFAEGIVLFKDAPAEPITNVTTNTLTREERAQLDRLDPRHALLEEKKIATDGFELWIENARGEREVITRLGEEIIALLPHPAGSYILYQTKTAIHAIERDGRNRRNVYTLAMSEGMQGLAINTHGTELFFETKKDGITVLWKRVLQ